MTKLALGKDLTEADFNWMAVGLKEAGVTLFPQVIKTEVEDLLMEIKVKVIVVYESKYGNTKRVAETIVESMKEIGTIDISISELKEINVNTIPNYDAILIGSPNHMGGPTRGIRGFIDKLGKLQLEGKKFAVFDTYMGKDFGKAVKKMEKQIREKVPGLMQIASGLSIKVLGMKGPIAEGELQKCKDFGKKIAAQLKSSL